MLTPHLSLAAALLALASPALSQAPDMLVLTDTGELYDHDSWSGESRLRASVGLAGMHGLTLNSPGTALSTVNGNTIVEIDLDTGAATTLGQISLNAYLPGIAFDQAAGVLYFARDRGHLVDGQLFRVDPVTLQRTLVGELPGVTGVRSLSFTVDGRLIALDVGEQSVAYPGLGMVEIDVVTGGVTDLAPGVVPTGGGLYLAVGANDFGYYGYQSHYRARLDTEQGVFLGGDTHVRAHGAVFTRWTEVGFQFCPNLANSTGDAGELVAVGSEVAATRRLTLRASHLPPFQSGYFLASRDIGFVFAPAGSQGWLCVGGNVARLRQVILNSGPDGTFELDVDLASIPLTPAVPVLAGETWLFQGWHRDQNPLPTSNFTSAVSVTFQ